MTPSRRTFLLGLAAFAATPALAACAGTSTGDAAGSSAGTTSAAASSTAAGSSTTAAGSSSAATASSAASSAVASSAAPAAENVFPATITHKFGTTEVTAAPKRVVCVGLVEQDALLALDIVPVGVTKWFGEAPGCIFPWATDKLGSAALPTVLDPTDGIPVEKVAALKPDLIIGLYSGMTAAEYKLLSKIAPTVAQAKDYVDYGMPWDESTLAIGTAIGKPVTAKALVTQVSGLIDQAAADHPEFKGKQAAVVTPYEGLFVYGPEDPRGRMLAQLGFTFPEKLKDPSSKEFGWSLSSEHTSDLAALGAVVWLDYTGADAGMKELFQKTPAYTQGRYFDISDANGAYYVGQSMVTPLSIPYVLERYIPQLAAAVDGDPATKPPVVKA